MGTENRDRKSLRRNQRKLRTCNFAEYRFSLIPLNSAVSCFGKISTFARYETPNTRQHPGSFRSQGLWRSTARQDATKQLSRGRTKKNFQRAYETVTGPGQNSRCVSVRVRDCPVCALSFRPRFLLSLFLSLLLSFWLLPFLFHHAGWHWILRANYASLRNRRNSSATGFSSIYDKKWRMKRAHWLRTIQRAPLCELDLVSFLSRFYEKFLQKMMLSFPLYLCSVRMNE